MKINWTRVFEMLARAIGYPPALYNNYASVPRESNESNNQGVTSITSAFIEERFMPQLIATNDRTGCLDSQSSDVITRAFRATFG